MCVCSCFHLCVEVLMTLFVFTTCSFFIFCHVHAVRTRCLPTDRSNGKQRTRRPRHTNRTEKNGPFSITCFVFPHGHFFQGQDGCFRARKCICGSHAARISHEPHLPGGTTVDVRLAVSLGNRGPRLRGAARSRKLQEGSLLSSRF